MNHWLFFRNPWLLVLVAMLVSGNRPALITIPVDHPTTSLTPQTAPADARQTDVNAAVVVADFLAMFSTTEGDRRQLRAELLATYAKDAATDPKMYPAMRQMVQAIARAQHDALTVAALRGPLQQRIGAVMRAYPVEAKRGFLGYVQRHNPIVVSNSRFVITRGHIQRMRDAQNYVAKLGGMDPGKNTSMAEDVRTIADQFSKIPADEQQAIADSEIRLVKLVMVSRDKLIYPAVMSDIRKNLHTPADLHRTTRLLEKAGDDYVRAISKINGQISQFAALGAKNGIFTGLTTPGNRP